MKWILWTAGGLALLGSVIAAIGALLPQRHSSSRRARYKASPEALYAVIAGPPDWRTGIKGFGELPSKDNRRQWWEEDTHNHKIPYEMVEDRPPTRIVTRIADPKLPFGGTWTLDISPAPYGCELRIQEDGVIYNPIFRFMARFFFGYTSTIETFLRDLGAKFGQAVNIEA